MNTENRRKIGDEEKKENLIRMAEETISKLNITHDVTLDVKEDLPFYVKGLNRAHKLVINKDRELFAVHNSSYVEPVKIPFEKLPSTGDQRIALSALKVAAMIKAVGPNKSVKLGKPVTSLTDTRPMLKASVGTNRTIDVSKDYKEKGAITFDAIKVEQMPFSNSQLLRFLGHREKIDGTIERVENNDFYADEVDRIFEETVKQGLYEHPNLTRGVIKDLTERDDSFRYMMLDRMRTDMDYFLDNENSLESSLWAKNFQDQKQIMTALWESLPEKPEWLTREQLDGYAAEMNDNKHARLDDVLLRANELGIEYHPVGLKGDITIDAFNIDLDEQEEPKTFQYATIEKDNIILFESLYDVFEYDKGVYLEDIPEDAQQEIIDRLFDSFFAENDQIVVVEDKQEVPSYALGALINGDLSGIEDEEDEKNIREFDDKNAGYIYDVKPDSQGFVSSPAFGKATDCETVFMVRPVTPKELEKENLERELKNQAKKIIHDRIASSYARSFTPEQTNVLNKYREIMADRKPAKELFTELMTEVSKMADVARCPEKWRTDTAKELDDLAEGKTRNAGQELKR